MLSADLRKSYTDFFVEKGHLHLPSAPLIPIDALGVEDKSTLFTSAGMQQFKPFFTGEATPPSRRITTVQKCVRTGDIDSVGDLSHCTFFEMLGNFSFGDYFKAEVIPWTWEYLVDRLKLDPDRMCVTVYLDDDEAYDVWHRVVGLPHDRIHRLGGDKNYWPANAVTEGPNGPCGPCTELFYRVVPESEMTHDPNLSPTERYKIDDAAGRWLELWNNVFTQFNRAEDPDGAPRLDPLPSKNNDTGAGFERIVCVLQGAGSVFETDLFSPVIARIAEISGKRYRGTMEPTDFAFRVVAEHVRTASFCIADGVLPLNEGRGYVLRRIMRRAVRFGKTVLGMEEPFLHEVAPATIAVMGAAYPELEERREHIIQTIRAEEERFRRTLEGGMQRFYDFVGASGDGKSLSGQDAFTLYDTYGFPLELTQELAAEQGVSVDLDGFSAAMEDRRRQSQAASGLDKDVFGSIGAALAEVQRNVPPTEFVGYETLALDDARVVAIIREGDLVEHADAGEAVDIVLDRTPFYAESGGQVGDTGQLTTDVGCTGDVHDTVIAAGVRLHRTVVRSGRLLLGDVVHAEVDRARRASILRNHTATHLLHAALRQVLGTHVHQKGSLVAPERLRFDFTHTKPMTDEEIRAVEDLVNEQVLNDRPVTAQTGVSLDEARRRGAMALFGEKYGDTVRVVEVPGFSMELCGGTHLERTSQVGLFKIVSETGVAAGVRRVEALTGSGAWEHVKHLEDTVRAVAATLRAPQGDVLQAAARLVAQRAEMEKQLRQLRSGSVRADDLQTTTVHGVTLVTGSVAGADPQTIAALADRAVSHHRSAVVLVGGSDDSRVLFVAKVTPDLVKRGAHAGNLVREVARIVGGNGGGKPEFAQAGGKDPSKLEAALEAAAEIVARQLQ
ncbi:MAG: alanine--tRNA ligase [Chthonomonadales bacterium]|nr:alanine--tRNA ligase [Chthonomonadales bacterium]